MRIVDLTSVPPTEHDINWLRKALQAAVELELSSTIPLTSVGGTPDINTLAAAPTYPGPLPGGVHPGLTVSLGGLSQERVKHVFMEIEKPEPGTVAFHEGRSVPTIGAFYDAISRALDRLPARQRFSYLPRESRWQHRDHHQPLTELSKGSSP